MHQSVEGDPEESETIREYFFLGLLLDGSSYIETNMSDEEIASLVSQVLRGGEPVQ